MPVKTRRLALVARINRQMAAMTRMTHSRVEDVDEGSRPRPSRPRAGGNHVAEVKRLRASERRRRRRVAAEGRADLHQMLPGYAAALRGNTSSESRCVPTLTECGQFDPSGCRRVHPFDSSASAVL